MHRFFEDLREFKEPGQEIYLEGENHEHLAKSLRMRVGETVVICDGRGTDYLARIEEVAKGETKVILESRKQNNQEAPVAITLYQGLPKGQKMDLIVQKSVELGINSIVPIHTDRSIPKERDKEKKTLRWNKIALEAAKQSGRGIVPVVEESMDLLDLAERLRKHPLNLVAYEEKRNQRLIQLLSRSPLPSSTGILIGPEGGFDPLEIQWLEEHLVHVVGLGPRILRTETAAMALLSMMLYEWELKAGGEA